MKGCERREVVKVEGGIDFVTCMFLYYLYKNNYTLCNFKNNYEDPGTTFPIWDIPAQNVLSVHA